MHREHRVLETGVQSGKMTRLPCKDHFNVQFLKPMLRHVNIRDQKSSLEYICPEDPHQRNPNTPKFEGSVSRRDRRCILKLKEKHKTTFFSPSENWCLSSSSTIKSEEREFVVDSGASMHMISKKDLNSDELEIVTTSRSPMTVITVNDEVQTNEKTTVYVRELDTFLTMKLLEDTSAVLSLGKLCDEHGYSYEWINGQKPHLIKNDIRIQCNTENFVKVVVPGLSTTTSSSSTSTSTTPWGQEIDHSNHHPAIESSENVHRQARGDPFTSETEELLHEPSKIPKSNKNEDHEQVRGPVFRHTRVVARIHRESCGWKSSWTQRLTREFFSWYIFRIYEKWGFV